jgi:hypothetical protein
MKHSNSENGKYSFGDEFYRHKELSHTRTQYRHKELSHTVGTGTRHHVAGTIVLNSTPKAGN